MLVFSLTDRPWHVPSLHLHNMAYVDRLVCTTRRCRRRRHRHRRPRRFV